MSARPQADGLGQSFAEEARWLLRYRRARRMPVTWRRPDVAEIAWWDGRFGRFADSVLAVADVDGRRWAVFDRMWHGWPDPPEHVWFALGEADRVWAARDFDRWPAAWVLPPPTTTPPP